ncbi:proline--tRNA ligase [Bacteriovorax sp. Seq25_V]|uniref:proline--tRNA ligase n=1 Tax=Bacteriovorax sp. Seq25_V TaxID=1201288 RepID=UPI000389DE18|nr:proline--tRNA ligase [Bacteriovorax sp. Seq25_V]EQC43989.1 proline--tRNA ligase [Bacteriovorax sp. Seq25_V]
MKTAITPTREEDFNEWYQEVVKSGDLAENSPVRGCMIIKPHGYSIWEGMQKHLDAEFKRTGHQNVYFPMLIPLSYLEKEAEHVEGFAKECAVVTHRRLVKDGDRLKPDGELGEPYVIRPTSEMVIGEAFAKWVNSYRDLPIKINQWANVMRWEMRPRIFLRTSEFLWQEGHTVHATAEEAVQETLTMLEVYRSFFEDVLAIPVMPGQKTESEKFPGADSTYTIEAMMQDGKALQGGTSHFLGQNFAKAQGIKFADKDLSEKYAFTTSWGVSTRMIGGLIMTHSDDDGLVLPPKIAAVHVKLLPIYKKEAEREEVLAYVNDLMAEVSKVDFNGGKVSVEVDDRDIRGGEKYWSNVKKGYPIILEIGPRDVKNGKVFMTRRDLGTGAKSGIAKDDFISSVASMLEEAQANLYTRAKEKRDANIVEISSKDQFEEVFSRKEFPNKMGFAYIADNEESRNILSEKQMSFRCMPLTEQEVEGKTCIFTGEPVKRRVIIAKSY